MRRPSCPRCLSSEVQRRGYYFVQILRSRRRRYFCPRCHKSFSNQTSSASFRQKRPDLNVPIKKLLNSGMAQRQTARFLGCSKNTVDRKLQWLSAQALNRQSKTAPKILFIDEMESIEHTKLKPLTIPIAVGSDYRVYAMTVGRIRAKGHLAHRSQEKYGVRKDERQLALHRCFAQLKRSLIGDPAQVHTDQAPHYRALVKKYFPDSLHQTYSSRAHIRKKKEMVFLNQEKKVFDPLFPLNQRCAKLRQDIKRLSRRSWCTTKVPANLEKSLSIYIESQTSLT